MKQPIIGQKVNDEAIDSLIDLLDGIADADAVFYVGYPVTASVDSPITVPALLISEKYGLVCFDVVPSANVGDIPELKLKQRAIVLALKAKLLLHPDLANDDDLAVKVNCITYALVTDHNANLVAARIADPSNLAEALKMCAPFLPKYLPPLNAAIERVANIRPKSKRTIAQTPASKGSILKQIENQIANLDSWQKAAVIETPDGPQRIRGLAETVF
jgi:superfamily I DNA and RNA helicase